MNINSSYHDSAYATAWELVAYELADEHAYGALGTLFQLAPFFNDYVKNRIILRDRAVLVDKILRHTKGQIPGWWKENTLFSDATFRGTVTRLNLSYMPKLTNRQFRTISSLFPRLTVLILKGCKKLNDTSFTQPKSEAERPSDRLQKVLVTVGILSPSKEKQRKQEMLAYDRWKALKVLDISHCKHISDTSLHTLANSTKQLEILNLNGCKLLTPTGITNICGNSPELAELGIAGTRATDHTVKKIPALCPKIVRWNLGDLPLDDADLTHIVQTLPALRGIALDFCSELTHAAVATLFEGATKLQAVTLVGCDQLNPDTVYDLAKKYPHIQRIECWNDVHAEVKSGREQVDVLDSSTLRLYEWREERMMRELGWALDHFSF